MNCVLDLWSDDPVPAGATIRGKGMQLPRPSRGCSSAFGRWGAGEPSSH